MTHHKTVNWSCFYTCVECSFTHARFGLVYFEGLVSTAGNYWGEIGQYRFLSNLKLSYPPPPPLPFPRPLCVSPIPLSRSQVNEWKFFHLIV